MSYRDEEGPLRERVLGLERELADLTRERDALALRVRREHRRGALLGALLGAHHGELPGTAWPRARHGWLAALVGSGALWALGLVALGLGASAAAWALVNLAVAGAVLGAALVWAGAQRAAVGLGAAAAKLALAAQSGAGWWALRADAITAHPPAQLWCWWLPGAVLALTAVEGLALRLLLRDDG